MQVFSSANPEERERAVRSVVRRLMSEHSLSVAACARLLGRKRQILERQIADDGDANLRLADLVVLESALPGLVGELAQACKLDVRPCIAPGPKDVDVLHAATQAMRAATAAGAEVLEAVADGKVTPSEAATARRLMRATRVALSKLEAAFEGIGQIQ